MAVVQVKITHDGLHCQAWTRPYARSLRPLTLTTPVALEDSLFCICTPDNTAQRQHTDKTVEQRSLNKLLRGTFVAISGSGPFIASLEDEHPILANLLLLTHPGKALLQDRKGRGLSYRGDEGRSSSTGSTMFKAF